MLQEETSEGIFLLKSVKFLQQTESKHVKGKLEVHLQARQKLQAAFTMICTSHRYFPPKNTGRIDSTE